MAAPPTRDFAGARDLKPPLSTATAASNGSTAKTPAAATEPAPPPAAGEVDTSDPLAAFQAEIAAVEAEVAAAVEAEAGVGSGHTEDAGGPATPEELEFEDDDGTVYVWDGALRKYLPKDAGTAAAAAAAASGGGDAGAYDLEAMTFAADDEVLPTLAGAKAAVAAAAGAEGVGEGEAAAATERKRKRDAIVADHKDKMAKKAAAKKEHEEQQRGWFELKNNTSVYVNGLPFDTNEKEVAAVFSKCGLIKEGPDAQPRVKLYRDKDGGGLKGDALVTYLKAPSVQLATTLLDGTPLRDGGKPMSVTQAKFEMKGEAYQAKDKATAPGGAGAQQQQRKRGPKAKGGNRASTKAQLDRLEKKLGWGGFDDKLPLEKITVILTGMFDPRELESQLGAAEELEVEVKEECSKMGPVDKVRVFKGHPLGVVSVRFKTEEGVQAALQRLDGRFFGGRRIGAALWDGITNYNFKVKETPEEEAARLEAYTRDMEAKATAAAAAAVPEAAAAATGGGSTGTGEAEPMDLAAS